MNPVSADSESPTSTRASWDPYEIWCTRVRAPPTREGVLTALQTPFDHHAVQPAKEKASGLAGSAVQRLPAWTWPVLTLALALGLNRELVGIFRVDLISLVFGVMTPAARVMHVLLGVSAISAVVMALGGRRATPHG